jgi:hypothetical protein
MSIQGAYRRMPDYFAVPAALLISAVGALGLAVLSAFTLTWVLEIVPHHSDGLDDAINAFFFVAPGIALGGFVSCFSILINWHHATSWRTPTFALVLGAILIWVWAHDFGGIGFAWCMPGTIAWLVSCWLLHRKSIPYTDHVLQA